VAAQLWRGAGNREPLTTAGIYQMIARHGRRCGLSVYSHRLRHHFSRLAGPRRARGRPHGTQRLDLSQMLCGYGASARSARARRYYDRIMTDT
jgi:hypothetical protein